jgi:hypothetical protein
MWAINITGHTGSDVYNRGVRYSEENPGSERPTTTTNLSNIWPAATLNVGSIDIVW